MDFTTFVNIVRKTKSNMENFIKYIKSITANPILPDKKKFTATVLMPELDTTEGIYRSILPSYVFTGSKDLRMLCVAMNTKMNISQNEKDYLITAKMIKETDHFIFPFVSYPLQPIIDELRKVKDSLKFSYYIDANYYVMPDTYPHAKEYNQAKMIESIENNIRAVDQVIVTNKMLKNYIGDKIKEKYASETFNTLITYQPLFVLPELTKTQRSQTVGKNFRVLIIADEYQFPDINHIKGILMSAKTKFKDKLEIHILGFDGKRGDKDYLKELEFKHHKQVEYYKYFDLIRHISPNCLMIPAKKTKFNETSKNYIKYLEFACLNIPVIAPDHEPYTQVMENNLNGFLAKDKEDFLFQLETLITDPVKYSSVITPANALVSLDLNIAMKDNIDVLTRIYFPDYVE